MDALPRNASSERHPRELPHSPAGAGQGVSLILPAHNEAETIQQAIREADDALQALTADYEILIVDDGSTDATAKLAEAMASRRSSVRVLRQPTNQGYGAALRRGFSAATKPRVAFTDADCQFDPRQLDRLLLLARDHDVVCGYRIDRQDPWHRKLYSHGYNLLVRSLLGTGVRDCDCALKMFRREVIDSVPMQSDGFFVNAEMLARARLQGKSIVEVGVTHRPRPRGQSTVSWRQVIPVGRSLLGFWYREILFPGPTNPSPASARPSTRWQLGALLTLCVIALCLLVSNLSYPLVEPDETRYAQVALEMVQSGDWLVPMLDGKPYLDKPPLLYWMSAAAYRGLGVSELSARLPCAISALLTVLVTFGLGRRLVGDRAAWCGAIVLMLCGGFVLSGHFLIMDGPLTLFTTATLLMAYLGVGQDRFHLGWCLGASIACGLGILTKGPVAIVLTLPPLLATRWLTGNRVRLGRRRALVLIAPALAICMPWFVAVCASHHEFAAYFFWRHHVVRFFEPFKHGQPWWFYIPAIFGGAFPASMLLPPLVLFLGSRAPQVREVRTPHLGFLVLAAVWIVAFFSLASCKIVTYVLPSLPLLGLVIGRMLDAVALAGGMQCPVSRMLQRAPKHGTVTLLIGSAVIAAFDVNLRGETRLGMIGGGLMFIAAGLLLVVIARRSLFARPRVAWSVVTLVAVGSVAFLFNDCLPQVSRLRSIHVAAAKLQNRVDLRHAPIVYFERDTHTATFHVPARDVVTFGVQQLQQLDAFMREHPRVVIVAAPYAMPALRQQLGSAVQLQPADQRGRIFVALRRQPPAIRLGDRPRPLQR